MNWTILNRDRPLRGWLGGHETFFHAFIEKFSEFSQFLPQLILFKS